MDGQMYAIKLESEDDEAIHFSASYPLAPEIDVTGMVYLKTDQTLTLEIGTLGKQVVLELFDQMISRKDAFSCWGKVATISRTICMACASSWAK